VIESVNLCQIYSTITSEIALQDFKVATLPFRD